MQTFPQPCHLGSGATRWSLSDILKFEAAQRDVQPSAVDPADERFLSAAAVARRFGVTASTIWRWSLEARRAGACEAAQ